MNNTPLNSVDKTNDRILQNKKIIHIERSVLLTIYALSSPYMFAYI